MNVFVSEFGTCRCWGDPHCESFDHRFMHFQGACEYALALDGCEDGMPAHNKKSTFLVVQKNSRTFGDVTSTEISWVKEIYVYVDGHVSYVLIIFSWGIRSLCLLYSNLDFMLIAS